MNNMSKKNNWQTKKLVDICDLITCGVAARPKYVTEGIPFLSAKNVKNGKVIWSGFNKITKENHQILTKNNKPTIGDLLYTRVGSYGEAAVIESSQDFSLFVSLTLIKPNKKLLDPYFLKYFLNSPSVKNIAKKSISSSGVGNLNVGTVRQFPISLPSISEQIRIVRILNEIFEKIDKAEENTEKNLQNSKELFENYLQNMFANNKWNKLTLKEISSMFGRGKSKHRPRNDKKLYGGIFPFIQTGDIRNSNHYITKYSQTYNETGLAQSKLWPTGTICITIAANIAETGILTFDACFPDSVIGIVANPKIALNEYVEYLLESFKSFIQSKGKGSAQANINMTTFENERFPFPDIKLQKEIVKKLDKLSEQTKKLEENYKQKLILLDELRKSVLQKAFSGNL